MPGAAATTVSDGYLTHFDGRSALCYKHPIMALDAPHIITALTTLIIVIASVIVHYEGLSGLTKWVSLDLLPPRARIATLIFGQLILHVIEIWIFAAGYYVLTQMLEFGTLLQSAYLGAELPLIMGFADYVYYSATVYSTLGFGDLVPHGPVRLLTGMEAVLGLVLITWSASFTFLEMQRYWGRD